MSVGVLLSGAAWAQPAAPSNLSYVPGMSITVDSSGKFVLGLQLTWQNNDPNAAYVVVETSTNNGASWFHAPSDVHAGTMNTVSMMVPQGAYYLFRVFCIDGVTAPQVASPPSNVLPIWGEQAPSNVSVFADNTNQVRISWKDNSGTEDGFLVERATNSAFTGAISYGGAPADTAVQDTIWATNSSFAPNVTYYWRVSATNRLGYITERSSVVSAAPNALPSPPSFFNAFNSANGVQVQWNAGGGVVDRWYVNVSVGGTNQFVNLYSTPGGSSQYNISDTSQKPATTCYYQCIGSNAVGAVPSNTKSVFIPQVIGSSVWYVDNQATGNNTGTNWANAFPNFASISWANVRPGAVIWVAPGNYEEVVNIGADGTSNAPITLKVATTNSPRFGVVQLQGMVNGKSYFHLDGAKSDTFRLTRTQDITNNIGLRFYGNTNIARAFYSTTTGLRVKWVEATGPYVNQVDWGEGSVAGIFLSGGVAGDTEVGYCWIHDMTADDRSGGDGVCPNPDSGGTTGSINIHHCIVERVRDNFIGGGGGCDIHDCILRDWSGGDPKYGHPDGIQTGADFMRIYNNVIRDTPGTIAYLGLWSTNTCNVMFYNNVVYGTGALTNSTGGIYPGGGLVFYTPGLFIPTMTLSNVLVANNTFSGFDTPFLSVSLTARASTNLLLKNWVIANNLAFTHSPGGQFGGGYTIDSGTGTNFSPADVVMDWNNVCGTNQFIGWKGNNYTTATIGAVTGAKNNFSYTPQFVNAAGFDFHLAAPDLPNMKGTNLSAWLPIAPGLDRTLDGVSRAALDWHVGALSTAVESSLACWLSFNNFTGTSDVKDATQNQNDALLYNQSPTNWPTAASGPYGTGAAWITSYRYFVMTNLNGVLNQTNGTVALWGYYTSNSVGDSVFLDFGKGETNGWWFGRDNSFWNTRFWIDDGVGGMNLSAISFPDAGFAHVNSDKWHHYAVTWTGGTFVGYYDGVAFATNTIANAPARGAAGNNHWAAIGCYTHGGTPIFTDDEGTGGAYGAPGFPNNGWLQGGLADVRIYTRALAASEIQNIASGSSQASRPMAPQALRVIAVSGF